MDDLAHTAAAAIGRTYALAGVAVLLYMTTLYLVARVLRRNDVADVAWGPGFFLIAMVAFVANDASAQGLLMNLLVGLWALRLALHIGLRNRGKGEDHRYRGWRESWAAWFQLRAYLQIFVLQGLLMLIIAAPVVVAHAASAAPMGLLESIGLALWVIGFGMEAVADAQLRRFVQDPANRGRFIETGLWRYSRHPNYFGEVVLWWGVWLMVARLPYGWFAVVGPVCITFLILRVSGVPMMEEHLRKRAGFEQYSQRVSKFFPARPTGLPQSSGGG